MNFEEESKLEQIQELIDTALSNKHNEVEQINNLNEYLQQNICLKVYISYLSLLQNLQISHIVIIFIT